MEDKCYFTSHFLHLTTSLNRWSSYLQRTNIFKQPHRSLQSLLPSHRGEETKRQNEERERVWIEAFGLVSSLEGKLASKQPTVFLLQLSATNRQTSSISNQMTTQTRMDTNACFQMTSLTFLAFKSKAQTHVSICNVKLKGSILLGWQE